MCYKLRSGFELSYRNFRSGLIRFKFLKNFCSDAYSPPPLGDIRDLLGTSPFEVLYGHTPKQFGIDNFEDCKVDDLKLWLSERHEMIALVKMHLQRAQQQMKPQDDKKRSPRSFSIGDMVFLKLQPYIQNFVATRANNKLAFRHFGPYKAIKKVNEVAYELQLPSLSSVHLIFHVS